MFNTYEGDNHMATTKKTATKRKATTTKKAAPKKKTITKKPASKATSTRSTSRATKAKATKSFKLQRSAEPFISLKITVQTLYWLILAGAVLLLGLWVLDISQKVQTIYDEIDSNMRVQSDLDARELDILRKNTSAE